MEIQWEEPPKEVILRSRASGAKYIDFAIALREHVGRWAVLPLEQPYGNLASAQSAAQNIRRGVTKAFAPKGSYEAVAGSAEKIWVRFLGDPEEPAASTPPADPEEDDDEGGDGPRIEVQDDARNFARTVRAWARENDIAVPERGRLPESIIVRYCEVTGMDRPAHLKVVGN